MGIFRIWAVPSFHLQDLHSPIDIKSLFSFTNSKLAVQFGIFGIGFEIAINLSHTFKDQHTETRGFLSEKVNYKKNIHHYKLPLNYGEAAGVMIPGNSLNS